MSLSKLNELAFQPQPPLSTFDSLTKRLISYVAVVAALGETSSIAREPKLTYRSRTLLALCLALFAFLGAFHPSRAAAASNNLILDGSFEEAPAPPPLTESPPPSVGLLVAKSLIGQQSPRKRL